jgi:hypothetical protein
MKKERLIIYRHNDRTGLVGVEVGDGTFWITSDLDYYMNETKRMPPNGGWDAPSEYTSVKLSVLIPRELT